jgi:hypothetical protein
MGEGLFRGCCTPGKSGNGGSLALPPHGRRLVRWNVGCTDLPTNPQANPMVSCASLVAIKKALQPEPWVNSVVAVPALIPGPHLGAHESRTVSRTDWSCELFPNRCIVEDLIAPWAKSAAAFRKEVYF